MLAYIMVNKQAFKGSRQVSWPSLQYRKRTDDVAGKGDVIGRHPHRLTGVTVPWLDTQVRYFISFVVPILRRINGDPRQGKQDFSPEV